MYDHPAPWTVPPLAAADMWVHSETRPTGATVASSRLALNLLSPPYTVSLWVLCTYLYERNGVAMSLMRWPARGMIAHTTCTAPGDSGWSMGYVHPFFFQKPDGMYNYIIDRTGDIHIHILGTILVKCCLSIDVLTSFIKNTTYISLCFLLLCYLWPVFIYVCKVPVHAPAALVLVPKRQDRDQHSACGVRQSPT